MSTYKVKITSKRQVTFPRRVLDELQLKPGDIMEIHETATGYALKPRTVDLSKLMPLQSDIHADTPAFDVKTFRESSHAPNLRD